MFVLLSVSPFPQVLGSAPLCSVIQLRVPPPPPRFRMVDQTDSPVQANTDTAKLIKALEKVQGEAVRLDGYMKV